MQDNLEDLDKRVSKIEEERKRINKIMNEAIEKIINLSKKSLNQKNNLR